MCLAEKAAPPLTNHSVALNPLKELKKRQIISPDAEDYTEEDLQTLVRMKKAEALGAIDFLTRKLGDIQAFTIQKRGDLNSPIELNRAGFEKYLFLLSQKAIGYFDLHHVEPKQVFNLTDTKDRKIFDKDGLLTLPGETLFNQILEKRRVEWKLNGKTMANYRMRRKSSAENP